MNTLNFCKDWEEIHEFTSLEEFERFISFLNSLLKESKIIEIPAESYYITSNEWNKERWFICGKTKWRLVPPDFPFKGLFIKVK
ncbi:MAG: hypothetical protein LPK19_17700 [Hymenobacteraceae bacterium]|nr:hypothetical protein [Hymenobacteraceae bacterium]MDX5398091.1 hypothetical protein [Hymenobacteraceae bacterium]MDX5514163.1 hypothetical protein [Hymenobacteraceae bacterium]